MKDSRVAITMCVSEVEVHGADAGHVLHHIHLHGVVAAIRVVWPAKWNLLAAIHILVHTIGAHAKPEVLQQDVRHCTTQVACVHLGATGCKCISKGGECEVL